MSNQISKRTKTVLKFTCPVCGQVYVRGHHFNSIKNIKCKEALDKYLPGILVPLKKDFENYSLLELVKIYSEKATQDGWEGIICYNLLEKLLLKEGLHRNLKEANSRFTAEKTRKYYETKYGVSNASQLDEIKEKKKRTCLEHYGVENPSFEPELIDKAIQTKLEKYGTLRPKNSSSSNGKFSKPHQKVSEFLSGLGISHFNEFEGVHYQKRYNPIPDIYIEDYNLIIEVNGDYWHANPLFYKPEEVFKTWEGLKTSKEIWEKDSRKYKIYKELNYNLLVIWETDIKTGFFETLITDKIKELAYEKEFAGQ